MITSNKITSFGATAFAFGLLTAASFGAHAEVGDPYGASVASASGLVVEQRLASRTEPANPNFEPDLSNGLIVDQRLAGNTNLQPDNWGFERVTKDVPDREVFAKRGNVTAETR